MRKFKLLFCTFLFLTITAYHSYAENIYDFNTCVPTIMYHKISDDEREWNEYCISSHQLREDFTEIKKAGFTPISVSEFAALAKAYSKAKSDMSIDNINELKSLQEEYPNPILITIDDGYDDGYTIIFPLLKEFGFKANISIVGSYSENASGFLSKEQIGEMSESGLVEFGSHTYSLHDKTYIELQNIFNFNRNHDMIKEDFLKNESFILSCTNKPLPFFTYPYGVSSIFTEKILDEMNVEVSFVTSLSPKFVTLNDGTRKISRLNRVPGEDSRTFVKKIIGKMKAQNAISKDSSLEEYYNSSDNPAQTAVSQDEGKCTVSFIHEGKEYLMNAQILNNTAFISPGEFACCKDIKVYSYNLAGIYKIELFEKEILINRLNNAAVLNGDEKILPVASGGLLPVRAFFEFAGYSVEYNGAEKKINIY